ncbi:transcription factor ILI6-like [Typha angustifolia]|uniref:transcription factor ILI6-like n=1 Tax=Typha angustifolia TaxID=59011 RepID=UPI003C2D3E92
MSSSRSRSRRSGSSGISEDQINDLVSKLQALLPESSSRNNDRVSAAKVLQDTCNYIRSLQEEVEDLSEKLAELLSTMTSDQAEIIRSLLM